MTAPFSQRAPEMGDLRSELAEIQARLNRVVALLDPVNSLSAAERSYALWLKGTLTPRERQALTYMVCGDTVQEIAKAMGVTFNTARTHVQNVRHKFAARTVVEVVVEAVRYGIVDPRRGGDPFRVVGHGDS